MRLVPLDYPKAKLRIGVTTPIEQQFRAIPCAKEPWTVEFIESMKRGDVLWDIGANVGGYSLIAAARGHDVVAIEPGVANFQALLRNARVNAVPGRIYAMQLALGATTEKIAFTQQAAPGYAEGGDLSLEVQQITLDDIVSEHGINVPPPTHLKIDVDGHELGVLAGAERAIKDSRLRAILIEVKLDLGERVSDLLAMWGWRRTAIYDTRNGQRIAGIRYELHERVPVGAEDAAGENAGEPSSAAPELVAA